MDAERFKESLADNYQRLYDLAQEDLTPRVPTCPEWTVDDLAGHVARVYLHKVECMRLNAPPKPWPPDGLQDGPRLELLRKGYAAVTAEFAARAPGSPAWTFYDPDQTVGFWLRRMLHETVIHRIDAELASGAPSQTVADDVAFDGIDEILTVFVAWASEQWPEDFVEVMPEGGGSGRVALTAGARRWVVAWSPDGRVRVAEGSGLGDVRESGSGNLQATEGSGQAGVRVTEGSGQGSEWDAELSGTPDQVLRWLWRRAAGPVAVTGDESKVDQLHRLMRAATQ